MVATVTTPAFRPADNESGSIDDMLAEFTVHALSVLHDTIEAFMEGTQGAERAKLAAVKTQIADWLASMEKAKQAGGLAKAFAALGKVGVALAFVCAIVAPSPMTIGLLAVSLVFMLEPIISDAAGEKSLIESGMGEMLTWLKDQVGSTAAIVLTCFIMTAVLVACTAAASAGVSALGSAASSMVQAMRNFMAGLSLPMLGSIQQTPKLVQFLEMIQSTMMLAQAGVQIDMAILQLKAAQLMEKSEIGQAVIDALVRMIKMAQDDMYNHKQLYDQIHAAMADKLGLVPTN
jgi:hypothetical protein